MARDSRTIWGNVGHSPTDPDDPLSGIFERLMVRYRWIHFHAAVGRLKCAEIEALSAAIRGKKAGAVNC